LGEYYVRKYRKCQQKCAWFSPSSARNCDDCKRSLAECRKLLTYAYESGGSTEAGILLADVFRDKKYIRQAVKDGHPRALYLLGRQLLYSIWPPTNKKAIGYLKAAAAKGDADAMYELGNYYW